MQHIIKIGDRVACIKEFEDRKETLNCYGTVIAIDSNFCRIGVHFDNHIKGHDCNRECPEGHGWFFNEDANCLKLIEKDENDVERPVDGCHICINESDDADENGIVGASACRFSACRFSF